MPPRHALLSMFEKTRLESIAAMLHQQGWGLLASGGTADGIAAASFPVRNIADLVGGGAMLGHRVVTLSRELHAGLLARNIAEDVAEMQTLGLPYIDLVVMDPYPLHRAITDGKTPAEINETVDIGGPTLIRSAVKGGRLVVCDPDDMATVMQATRDGGTGSDDVRAQLHTKALHVITGYDAVWAWSLEHQRMEAETLVGRWLMLYKQNPDPWSSTGAFFAHLGMNIVRLRGREPIRNAY